MTHSFGSSAAAVFYLQAGQVKLTVASQQGEEVVVAMLERGGFVGQERLAGQLVCAPTTTFGGDSSAVRVAQPATADVLQDEPTISELLRYGR